MVGNRARFAIAGAVASATVVAAAGLFGWWTIGDDGSSKGTASRSAAPATQPPGTTSAQCNPESVIASWPLEKRLAQLLMVGVDPRTGNEAEALVGRYGVGGVFIGGDASGIFEDGSLARLPAVSDIPPLVAVDDEGGRVQRIDQLAGPLPSARTMARTMTPAQVRDIALQRGRALRDAGVTMDLAPVVDVSDQSNDQVIGDRSFADDPGIVSEYAEAFASGLRDAGVFPVFKHFPGHGHANGDSHRQAAATPPLADLEASDLIPYQRLLTGPQVGVMVGHLDVPGLTAPGEPASVSPSAVGDLLRSRLGYQGFVITDDLSEMQAIKQSFGVPEAALRALLAGNDMALLVDSADFVGVLGHLVDAGTTRRLDETQINRSVLRVLTVKGIDPCRRGVRGTQPRRPS
jgi:beta-N-acetylhexosaminidase